LLLLPVVGDVAAAAAILVSPPTWLSLLKEGSIQVVTAQGALMAAL
jgi:hypothetical protein